MSNECENVPYVVSIAHSGKVSNFSLDAAHLGTSMIYGQVQLQFPIRVALTLIGRVEETLGSEAIGDCATPDDSNLVSLI